MNDLDRDQLAAAIVNGKVSRKRANHTYLGVDGSTVKDVHEAVGVAYEDVATGEKFSFAIPGADAGSPLTLLAVFGAKTLATNEASSVRNNPNRSDDDDTSEVEAIKDRFDLLATGVWREPGEGRAPTKVDRDQLAAAIVDVASAAGKTLDVVAVRQRLDDEPAYFRTARQVPAVTDNYNKRVGKAAPKPKSVSDLF